MDDGAAPPVGLAALAWRFRMGMGAAPIPTPLRHVLGLRRAALARRPVHVCDDVRPRVHSAAVNACQDSR